MAIAKAARAANARSAGFTVDMNTPIPRRPRAMLFPHVAAERVRVSRMNTVVREGGRSA